MKYTIVSADDPKDLVAAVNVLCEKDWRPHGSMVVMSPADEDDFVYNQPMVFEDNQFDALAQILGPRNG